MERVYLQAATVGNKPVRGQLLLVTKEDHHSANCWWLNISAINYYITEDDVATTKQQDVVLFHLYAVLYPFFPVNKQDKTVIILQGVITTNQSLQQEDLP